MPVSSCLCCGTPACIPGPLACPSGAAASYTVSLPASVSFGPCTSATPCSPSDSSAVVSGSCAASWTHDATIPLCAAGYPLVSTGGWNIRMENTTNTTTGCAVWRVTIFFNLVGFSLINLIYEKNRDGASVNDEVGTYSFVRAAVSQFGPPTCSPITADATITVSP